MTTEGFCRWTVATVMATAALVTASCVSPPAAPDPSLSTPITPQVPSTVPLTQAPPALPVAAPVAGTPDGVTFLAGKPSPTYDNDASRAIISGDGKFVVFHHKTENLAITNRPPSSCPRPAATSSQVYRTDLRTGETVLVSVGTDGCYANGETTFPYTNDDGRFVVFMSFASNLIAGDTNARSDIFLKDMNPNGATTRISQRQNGAQLAAPSNRPSINGAGTKIVFNSNASNIVSDDTNAQTDCFLYDVNKGAAGIERISLGDNDQQLNGYNFRCDIAGDADAVVWVSDATNVMTGVPGTPNRAVYVRDLTAGTTELISKTPAGGFPTKTSTRAAISADGHYVVYQSTASDIIAGDPDTNTDIFRYDRVSNKTTEVSVTSAGTRVSAASTRSVISGDGRFVAFVSNSGKLVAGDRNKTRDVFMRDMTAGTTFLVSVNTAEAQAQSCAAPVVLSLDRQIEVQADAAETAGIAIAAAAAGADDISTRPTISDDGQVVAFVSDVCNLVPEQPQMAGFDGVIVRWTRQPLPAQL